MTNIGCRIYPEYQRPNQKLIDAFKEMPVANIDDCMNRTAALRPDIKRIGTDRTQLLGPAFTVKVAEGDNLMFHKAMDMAKPGDVIVIDAGGMTERSILGAIMATYCKSRGIKGIVIDGSIRDADELSDLGNFAVYAKAITPNGPYKNGPGELRGTISLSGIVVNPGDIIVGDGDGVIVVRPDEAEELARKTEAIMKKEYELMQSIIKEGKYDRPWVDEKIKEIGCEIYK